MIRRLLGTRVRVALLLFHFSLPVVLDNYTISFPQCQCHTIQLTPLELSISSVP